MPGPKRLIYASAFVVYATLSCVVTYPLVFHLSSAVPHDLGDPILSTAILWWNAHVLPFTERWWNGFAFYPAPGFLALSDPRVGESLLATPLQWLGCSPVAAYNLTLLATFPLSALAAHWLGFVLTNRHDAAAIGGLTYGFCPYRVAHLPHLELLAAFGMPAALAALHLYRNTRRWRWLAMFALALVMQGLCSSYYLVFFSVLLLLWLLWFVRRGDADLLFGVLAASAVAILALTPLAYGYSRIHAYYGLARSYEEILQYSADATSLLTAHPTVMLWGWTARWGKPEGELFPGATIAVLALAGAIVAWRRGGARDRLDRLSFWLPLAACVFAAIAFCGWAYGPWRIAIAGVGASSDAPFKPLSVALLAIVVWVGVSSRVRGAYARRSAFAFYAIASVMLFLCSLGPRPTLAGHQFLYEPPYAWLMRLPVFASIRVPARFGLPAMLALAMTGALAFNQFRLHVTSRRALAAILLMGITADGLTSHVTLPPVPDGWTTSRANGFAAVLELPLGDTYRDVAAMYRATMHGLPIVNGYSGFEPRHYQALRLALDERDETALEALASRGPLVVASDRRADPHGERDRWLRSSAHSSSIADEAEWSIFDVRAVPLAESPCRAGPLDIVAARDDRGVVDVGALTDGDGGTFWITPHPQQSGDRLILDLGQAARLCSVKLSLGIHPELFPRRLRVETSAVGEAWDSAFAGKTGGRAVMAAIDHPRSAWIEFPLPAKPARFVRLTLEASHPSVPWIVTDVRITGVR
jgi:hypothetical protein